MMDLMECPHCRIIQDQSEPREWHNLGHSESLETKCDYCDKPIQVTACMCYEVSEVDE